ncbi:hypothetical protein EYR36_009176 [Pleurotus pulmonarius]|nr:hypothetical protein EYR36_009176 [Pleurotus pulmonarius]
MNEGRTERRRRQSCRGELDVGSERQYTKEKNEDKDEKVAVDTRRQMMNERNGNGVERNKQDNGRRWNRDGVRGGVSSVIRARAILDDTPQPVSHRAYNSDRLKHSDLASARSLSKISREWDAAWLRMRLLRDLLVRARVDESLSLRPRPAVTSPICRGIYTHGTDRQGRVIASRDELWEH